MANPRQQTTLEVGSGITHITGKVNMTQVSYFGITLLWVTGVVLYLFYLRRELKRRKQEEAVEDQKREQHRGKRCPQCGNIISSKRTVCQHCGYAFSEVEVEEATKAKGEVSEDASEDRGSGEHHHHHHGSSGRRRKKKRGKKCPQCNTVINYYREVCQHCGYKFENVAKPGDQPQGPESKNAAN
jgi:uncharacterized OB-fold protein